MKLNTRNKRERRGHESMRGARRVRAGPTNLEEGQHGRLGRRANT